MKKPIPEIIDLTEKEANQLLERLKDSNLSNDDQKLIAGVLNFCLWLQVKLSSAAITIRKLSKIFGVSSEKRSSNNKKHNKEPAQVSSDPLNADNQEPLLKNDAKTSRKDEAKEQDEENYKRNSKNKGLIPAKAYTGATKLEIKHPFLSAGDLCPLKGCSGRLYQTKPGNIIRIVGGKMAEANNYILEKLRCNLCGKIFKTELPIEVGTTKYDARFKANLMVHKYYLGLPFHRMERMQSYLGVPLPDSTQWHLIDQVANDVYPEFCYIEYVAAQGKMMFGDDTGTKILSVINQVKRNPNLERVGTFITAIISTVDNYKIYLFYPGKKHAGENVAALLKKRNKQLEDVLYMCDALSRNISTISQEFKAIIINCLAHGRRNFIDVEANFPEECDFVIKSLALIYKYDQETKEQKLSAEQRLLYHQKNSGPVMERLQIWCKEQLKTIEPNNGLAKAINYMLRHWPKLTRFLEAPGAVLDNNCCEEILKIPIRVRKGAPFFATEHGAFVAGMMTSLIVTAARNGANPIEYMTALQIYKEYVRQTPQDWLPWNYQDAVAKIQFSSGCSAVATG